MKINYKVMINCIILVFLFTLNLQSQSFKIVLSSNSLEPPGIYGTNSLNTGGFSFAYNSYWLKNVIYSSYPVYSPNSDVFARFETNQQGTKLIVRKASNGDSVNQFDITGFNPQWIGSSGKLYYEKPPANGVTECWSIDVGSGMQTKIAELRDQYYPASDPGLGAGALSPNGTKIAYLKGAAIFIYSISTGEEKPLVMPMEDNTVDDSLVRKVYLVAGPNYPNTIRHLSWSKGGNMIACYGQVNFKITFPPDTTLYPRSREGILVVNTSSGEVRTIYETQNYSFEHPENFFFSPSGRTLAFNVSGLNNKVHIYMANPKKSNSGRDRGIGRIIAGFPSKQYWALNPWSSDGSKLLYQNDDDGTLGYTMECSDGQALMNKDVRRISIQDAQWADVSAQPSPEPTISINDPEPELVRDSTLFINPGVASVYSNYVKGTAADGISKILIRFRTNKPLASYFSISLDSINCALGVTGNRNEDGSLSEYSDAQTLPQSTITGKTIKINDEQYGFAIYNAPLDFVRQGTNDSNQVERKISVSIIIDDELYHAEIIIRRPPIFLIHGLWSNPMVWNDFPPIGKKKNEQDPKFRVYRGNYERENNAAIRTIAAKLGSGKLNNGVLRQLIDYIYDFRRQTNFACSQADVITHSMGGMIARIMSDYTKYYFTNKNYLAGLIHKLITVDTPHLGSEYADLLWKSYTDLNGFQKWLLKKVLVANVYNDGPYDPDNPVDGGAIEDLQTTSPTVAYMYRSDNIAVQPPIHTFVGRASIAQQAANNINVSTLSRWFLGAGALTFGQVFINKKHDLVVSEPSQEAFGLFDNYSKRVTTGDALTHSPFKLGNPVISHTSGFGNKVLTFINSPRNSNVFSTNGRKSEFANSNEPDGVHLNQKDKMKDEDKVKIISTQGLKITSPVNETNLRFGETFNVDIEPSPGINLNRVIICGFEGIEEDSTPPFSFTLTVPFNSLMRKKQIFAIAEDSEGKVGIDSLGNLLTDSIDINLITDYLIDSIESGYEQTMNIRMGDSNNVIHTIGYFSDRAEREITWSADIQYTSSNPGIFTVQEGAIYPVSTGEATLYISYKGKSDSVYINIISDNEAPVIVVEKLVKVITGNDVSLEANQSYDPEQENISFNWVLLQKPEQSQVSIASPNQSLLNFNADQTGFYIFRLKVTDESGNSDSSYVSVEASPETAVKGDEKTNSINIQISPIPCDDKATLTYTNLKDESVSISLINSFGIEIAVLSENKYLSPGNHNLEINTATLTSGIYFLRLRTGTSSHLVKFIVLR